jgi:hypothetical protein
VRAAKWVNQVNHDEMEKVSRMAIACDGTELEFRRDARSNLSTRRTAEPGGICTVPVVEVVSGGRWQAGEGRGSHALRGVIEVKRQGMRMRAIIRWIGYGEDDQQMTLDAEQPSAARAKRSVESRKQLESFSRL